MALISYPAFLQPRTYTAQQVRYLMQQLVPREGIVNWGDFKVAQRAAGANMSVDVAAGEAWVKGDTNARQGYYHVTNDATVNVAIPAAHATLPRIDTVAVAVYDSTVTGATDTPAVLVVQGTATSGATLANLTGNGGGILATAMILAYVLVPAASTSVTDANIGYLSRQGISIPAVAGAPPFYAFHYPLDLGPPAVRIKRNSNKSVPTATETVVDGMTTEGADFNGMHDTVTNTERITIKVPGYYRVGGGASFEGNATGHRIVEIFLNGTDSIARRVAINATAGVTLGMGVETMYRMNYGDYIDMRATQNSGATLTVAGGSSVENSNVLGATWVSR